MALTPDQIRNMPTGETVGSILLKKNLRRIKRPNEKNKVGFQGKTNKPIEAGVKPISAGYKRQPVEAGVPTFTVTPQYRNYIEKPPWERIKIYDVNDQFSTLKEMYRYYNLGGVVHPGLALGVLFSPALNRESIPFLFQGENFRNKLKELSAKYMTIPLQTAGVAIRENFTPENASKLVREAYKQGEQGIKWLATDFFGKEEKEAVRKLWTSLATPLNVAAQGQTETEKVAAGLPGGGLVNLLKGIVKGAIGSFTTEKFSKEHDLDKYIPTFDSAIMLAAIGYGAYGGAKMLPEAAKQTLFKSATPAEISTANELLNEATKGIYATRALTAEGMTPEVQKIIELEQKYPGAAQAIAEGGIIPREPFFGLARKGLQSLYSEVGAIGDISKLPFENKAAEKAFEGLQNIKGINPEQVLKAANDIALGQEATKISAAMLGRAYEGIKKEAVSTLPKPKVSEIDVKRIPLSRNPIERLWEEKIGIPFIESAVRPITKKVFTKTVGKIFEKITGGRKAEADIRYAVNKYSDVHPEFKKKYRELVIGKEQVKDIAREQFKGLSEKLTKAEQVRLGQIIKGGITTIEKYAQLTEEPIAITKELREKLKAEGILGETYIDKPTKKEIAKLTEEKQVRLIRALAKRKGYEVKFTPKRATVGGALGVYQPKIKTIRVATGGKTKAEVLEVLTHELTHKAHGEIGEDVALQMTQTGKGKGVKYFDKLTKAIQEEKQTLLDYLKIDISKLSPSIKGYVRKPTEVLARIAPIIKTQPEVAKVKFPKTTEAFLEYVNKLPEWKAYFRTKTLDLSVEDIKKLRGVENPQVKKLIVEVEDIEKRIKQSYKTGGTRYMRRMYTSKELEKMAKRGLFPSRQNRLILRYTKQRKDIPENVRRELGEMLVPAPAVHKMISEQMRDVLTYDFFRFVAENPDITAETEALAAKFGDIGFEQMPETRTMGALRGKFIRKPEARLINKQVKNLEVGAELLRKATGYWKLMKIVNPRTMSRNFLSNNILAPVVSNVPYYKLPQVNIQAIKSLATKDGFYREAKEGNLLRSTYTQQEVRKYYEDVLAMKTDVGGKISQKLLGGIDKGAKAYGLIEDVGRMGIYRYWRRQGKTSAEAVALAEHALIDYADVAPALDFWRNNIAGVPFITFSAHAIPRTFESFVKRPTSFLKLALGFVLVEEFARRTLKLSLKKYRELKKNFPKEMQNGWHMLLPFKDSKGDYMWLDLTYILPFGDIGEKGASVPRAIQSIAFGNPFIGIPAQLMSNKTWFTEREIWKNTDTIGEKVGKATDFIYKSLLPDLAPAIPGVTRGGYTWENLVDTLRKKVTKRGDERSLARAVFGNILGLKTKTENLKEAKEMAQYGQEVEARALTEELRRTLRDMSLSNEDKKGYILRLQKDLDNKTKELVDSYTLDYFAIKATPWNKGMGGFLKTIPGGVDILANDKYFDAEYHRLKNEGGGRINTEDYLDLRYSYRQEMIEVTLPKIITTSKSKTGWKAFLEDYKYFARELENDSPKSEFGKGLVKDFEAEIKDKIKKNPAWAREFLLYPIRSFLK